jgi:hypothetical protein
LYNTARELVGGHNPFADWSRFQDRSSIPDGWMLALTWLVWLVVGSYFYWVYVSAWQRHRPAATGFWDYRWVASAFGLLSLTAVVVSIAVNDPAIVKSHMAFIVPTIVQTLALIGYGTYVVRSFARAA